MKRFNKIFLLIIILVGIFMLAAGCKKINFEFFKASDDNTDSEISTTTEDDQNSIEIANDDSLETDKIADTEGTEEDIANAAATPTPEGIQPSANVDLSIYTVDAEKGVVVPVTAVIPEVSEITPSLIVEYVVESLADQSINIEIKNVTQEADTIIVNFDKAFKDMGSGYEAAILDAMAQSLIDNLDDYNKVIYRVNDGAYVSGVFEYGINEVYFTR